ncbi:hypothetical protein JCM3770_002647 [Rhodotorula araucariae]
MWCNNCLLLFPLRGGAMALATLIAAYSIAGGIVLFMYGKYLWPSADLEVPVYGGISMFIGACSVLLLFAFANRSRLWTSALCCILPFAIVVSIARAGVMVFRLNDYQDHVIWECGRGGQLYNETLANDTFYTGQDYIGDRIPAGFCSSGFRSLYLAFAFALSVDAILQIYQYFLVWRFRAFLAQYYSVKDRNIGFYMS